MSTVAGKGYGPHTLAWAGNPSFSDVLSFAARDKRKWVVTCLIGGDNTGTITGEVSIDEAFTAPMKLTSLASDGTTSVITSEDDEAISFAVRLPYFRLASSADETSRVDPVVVITGD